MHHVQRHIRLRSCSRYLIFGHIIHTYRLLPYMEIDPNICIGERSARTGSKVLGTGSDAERPERFHKSLGPLVPWQRLGQFGRPGTR